MVSGIFSTSSMAASPPSTSKKTIQSINRLGSVAMMTIDLLPFKSQLVSAPRISSSNPGAEKPTPNSHGVMLKCVMLTYVFIPGKKDMGWENASHICSHLWLDRGQWSPGSEVSFQALSSYSCTQPVLLRMRNLSLTNSSNIPGPLQNPLQTPQSPEAKNLLDTQHPKPQWNTCDRETPHPGLILSSRLTAPCSSAHSSAAAR